MYAAYRIMRKFFLATCACIGLSLFTMTPAFAQSSCPYSSNEIVQRYNSVINALMNLQIFPSWDNRVIAKNNLIRLGQMVAQPGCEYMQEYFLEASKAYGLIEPSTNDSRKELLEEINGWMRRLAQ